MDKRYNGCSLLLMLLAMATLVSSCSRSSCPAVSGSKTKETRSLPVFNSIVVQGKLHLILTQDSGQTVTVSTGSNLQKGITTEVSQQTLTINNNNSCMLRDPSDWAEIHISSSQLQTITSYGTGDITSTNTLKAAVFTVDCWYGANDIRLSVQANNVYAISRHESATIRLTGSADSAYVYCGEAASVDLSALPVRAAAIDSKSIRDISVNVTTALHANIVYKGNVYYKGSPAIIDTLITDAGRLIHLPG